MIVRSVELLESENEHKLNGSLIGEEECAQGDYAHRDIEGVKPYDLKLIRDNLDAGVVSCVDYDDQIKKIEHDGEDLDIVIQWYVERKSKTKRDNVVE